MSDKSWFEETDKPKTGSGDSAAGKSGKPKIRVVVKDKEGKTLPRKSQLDKKTD